MTEANGQMPLPDQSTYSDASYQFSYGDFLRFQALISKHSGLNFTEKKRADLEAGLFKALQDAPDGIADASAYYHYLEAAATPQAWAELDRFISLLTIGETHFFRDSAQFDALAHQVLPAIIDQKRAAAAAIDSILPGVPQLRIWSAGSASGEEAYSLAILLCELIPDIEQWRILILATDLNREVLARAAEGRYSDWSFREPRAKAKRPHYFTQDGNRYQLRSDIRQMVTFTYHNLIEDDFPSIHNNTAAMDLIFCRNVTIYFAEETTRKIIDRFHRSLTGGGWLVVGHAEPSLLTYRDFQTHTFPNAILYQKRTLTASPTNGRLGEQTAKAARQKPANTLSQAGTPAGHPQENQTGSFDAGRIKLALRLMDEDNLSEITALLEDDLADVPLAERVSAHCLMARAYADQGQWEEARQSAQTAIALDSLCVEAYYVQALVDEHLGDLQSAIDNLNKVIYLNRDKPLPHFNLAMLYKKTEQVTQAHRALKNAINKLAQWPPDEIIPDTGGTSAQRLLEMARIISTELGLDGSEMQGKGV